MNPSIFNGLLRWLIVVKNPPGKQEMRVLSLGWEYPLEKEMTTHLPYGQKSLVSYSAWDRKEPDMT